MAKATKQTIVGAPLTPDLLTELGAVTRRPASEPPFGPEGDWQHVYRLWTCHGYRESGNQDVGFLRIRRSVGQGERTIRLSVQQAVVEADDMVSVIEADVDCSTGTLAVPIRWRMSSRFQGSDGRELPAIGTKEAATVAGDEIVIETSQVVARRPVTSPWTCDWSLFDVVQRLAQSERRSELAFHMLEGLSLWREDQRLTYRGRHQMRFGSEAIPLDCFLQVGRGILPTEYWLDATHRIVAVTSMNKAYIANDTPAEQLWERVVQPRKPDRRTEPVSRKESI